MVIRLSWPIVRIRVENIENAKNIEPCVYVFNHFSFADVYFAGYLPAYQTVVAVRSWPFKIPVLNIFMRIAEYMDVEKTQWEEILAQSEKILKDGGCILFFPEGHRSRNGSMHPLNKGAFRIAADNNVPIVPVSLQGTEYLGGYKSRMPVSPCRVKLRFYPPMRAEGKEFTDVNDLRERVEKLYLREVYNK